MKVELIDRVQAAHIELAKALGELRDNTPHAKVVRHLSVSITHAETAYLWFRAAVTDFNDEGKPR